ncbi:MAG: hypothetical protein ABIF82_07100 [Planctomycetota bacterium]
MTTRRKRKNIPCGSKLLVKLTLRERDLIRDHTLYDQDIECLCVPDGPGVRVDLPLDEIEHMQGFVAAEANHCDDRKLQNELDALSDKLQQFLDTYDDQEE